MHVPLRIGTRGSQLALWQARAVATRLEASGIEAELVIVRTSGDRLQAAPLSEIGGKRLFVKELEDALLSGEIDLAVHSAKDMPATLPEGLTLAATLPREDARDALVLPDGTAADHATSILAAFAEGVRIGTGSIRRAAQLLPRVPGARFETVRGNVDTRLRKLDEGQFDALVLASAGLRRLGLTERISAALPVDECVPAPGQGIVAIEAREGDEATRRAVKAVHHEASAIALQAERTVVAALGGGCQLPLGAFAVLRGAELELAAVVCSADGTRAIRARSTATAAEADELGRRVAAQLRAEGAVALLDEIRTRQGPVEGSY
jgi:hydroxymethylbilane synthase